jgi:hypothetical protein
VSQTYLAPIDVIGTVVMARVNQPRMTLALPSGKELESVYRPEDKRAVTTALQEHATTQLHVVGRAEYSADGIPQRIAEIEELNLTPRSNGEANSNSQPIWEIFEEMNKEVPEEEWAKLPQDFSANLDKYLYGWPERKP